MPNWCSNVVTFSGDKNQIKQALKLFRDMGRKGKKHMLGQLPEFISKEQPHFFDIHVKDDKVYLLTKSKPNNQALKEIADNFRIDFTNIFDDLPMGQMGEARYANGQMRVVCLDAFDFQCYDYDKETNTYLFGGDSYDLEWPLFLGLLERKVAMVVRNEILPVTGLQKQDALFMTTSRISKDELINYYGKLTDADLVLKFAEFKNFDAARAAFEAWHERYFIEVDKAISQNDRLKPENFATGEKYLAMVFLKQLIREWNDGRSQERISKLPAREQAQAELLKIRLAGKLPHIDIVGDDFTVDWRLRELRETAAPWNIISINDLRESESGREYLGLYDVSQKRLYTVDNEMTVVPQNVIGIEIPHENRLDPVAVAREKGFDIKQFVLRNPIQGNLKAMIRPVSETGLPELVEQNVRKSVHSGETEQRVRKFGR
jgi:hypothetical protein